MRIVLKLLSGFILAVVLLVISIAVVCAVGGAIKNCGEPDKTFCDRGRLCQ
jgi:hypothetical protein